MTIVKLIHYLFSPCFSFLFLNMKTGEIKENSLIVNEIFYSIQGESSKAGEPCIFIRLTGCGLRCSWCDTAYAFHEGKEMAFDEIYNEIGKYACNLIEFTGGEPLEQQPIFPFISRLCADGYEVLVESGGHVDISLLDKSAHCIMDVKCPGSKMEHRNRWENIQLLKIKDEAKFVIADQNDYEWAKKKLFEYKLHEKVGYVLFSPVFGVMDNLQLAEWILRDALPVRFQIQMHKYIWHPLQRGV